MKTKLRINTNTRNFHQNTLLHAGGRTLLALIFGALPLLAAKVQGQTTDLWTTDDFQVDPGLGAFGRGLGMDQNGNLFNVGHAADWNGTGPGFVRVQPAGNIGYTIADEFLLSGGTVANSLCFAPGLASSSGSQALFVGGDAADVHGLYHWIVNQSTDGGLSWSTIDSFTYGGKLPAYCYGLAVDAAGALYAVGQEQHSTSGSMAWLVRKGQLSTTGWSWSTVDIPTTSGSCANAIAVRPADGVLPQTAIFVVGQLPNGSASVWAVRRSTNGGATWSTVDTFPASQYSRATSVAVDTKGNVSVLGLWSDGIRLEWAVRESTQAGNPGTWNTINLAAIDNANSRPSRLTTKPTPGSLPDEIFTVGDVVVPVATWWVRSLSASLDSQGNLVWTATDLDSYQLASGKGATAYAVAFDASGNLVVTGMAIDSTGSQHWITRTLAAGLVP